MTEKPLGPEHRIDVATGLVLSIVTCGLYDVYWNFRQMEAMNVLLGRREYDFFRWLLLCFVTCGLYHVYYEYKMGQDLAGELKRRGVDANPNLPYLGLLLCLIALPIVADAVYQHELNKLAP